MASHRTKRVRRVLLAATVGLATLTLEGCIFSSGNLMAPPPDAGRDVGPVDAGTDTGVPDAGANTDAG